MFHNNLTIVEQQNEIIDPCISVVIIIIINLLRLYETRNISIKVRVFIPSGLHLQVFKK